MKLLENCCSLVYKSGTLCDDLLKYFPSPRHLFMHSNLFQYVSSRLSILLWIDSVEALLFFFFNFINYSLKRKDHKLHREINIPWWFSIFTTVTMRMRNRECTKITQNKQLEWFRFYCINLEWFWVSFFISLGLCFLIQNWEYRYPPSALHDCELK